MEQKKVKILAVGCLHNNEKFIEKLAKKSEEENVDLVILAGDLTYGERSIENIIGPFAKVNKRVLMIPGNHESPATVDFLQEMYSNAKSIHGNSFIHKNLGIFGAGGADFGIHVISEAEIFELLKTGHESIKALDKRVMVTHIHPYGSKSELSGFKGSKSVRKAIDYFKPDFAICAHIHEASGVEEMIGNTKVINVSRKEKIIEI